jgi:hypothetical protein
MAKRLLGRAEQARQSGEALALLALPRLAGALDVRGEAGLDPRALGRGEHEPARGEHEERDEHGQQQPTER